MLETREISAGIQSRGFFEHMFSVPIRSNIFHPHPYVERQIASVLKGNDLRKELFWAYLVACRYQNKIEGLVKKICSESEKLPESPKIWLEACLQPTRRRQEQVKCCRSRTDFAMGHLEIIDDRDSQIRANGEWVGIVESK